MTGPPSEPGLPPFRSPEDETKGSLPSPLPSPTAPPDPAPDPGCVSVSGERRPPPREPEVGDRGARDRVVVPYRIGDPSPSTLECRLETGRDRDRDPF